MPSRPIRIAGASGSASDRRHALAAFARNCPHDPVDVVIADYMSEYNMAVAAARRVDQTPSAVSSTVGGGGGGEEAGLINKSTGPAYEVSFLEALAPALDDMQKHGVKLAVNAGVTDTKALYDAVAAMVQKRGLNLKVAWISGDEVLPAVEDALQSGRSDFTNIYTGEKLADWAFRPIYAQAYLGGMGVAAALAHGADIVLCGRVADASPVIGAAAWWHGWDRSELDRLANAFVAGHLIECSTYVSGGNFSGFKDLEHGHGHEAGGGGGGGLGWSDIGFPIAEISADGQVVITKQKETGGAVTVDTCSAQLLYEIQGPVYFNSDVTAFLSDVHFELLSANRVALRGVRAAGPPPPTTKVGITARGGFQAEARWFLVGLDIPAKARMFEVQIRRVLAPHSHNFSVLSFSTLGGCPDDPVDQNSATATFRVLAQAARAEDLASNKFLRPIVDCVMQGYPGATFDLDLRQGFPKPIFEYFVSLLPQADIKHQAHLPHNNSNQTIDIPPPPTTKTYPSRPPTQPHTSTTPQTQTDFGPTVRAPLGWIVHARSGDKGSDANCGFWVRRPDEFVWLRGLLSTDKARELLGKEWRDPDSASASASASDSTGQGQMQGRMSIERFELPHLRGVHFLFRNLLDRGVGATSTVDFLGKNVAEFLRARWVDMPVRFLNRGKL